MAEYIKREIAFNALKDAAEREYKNRRYREKNAMDEARLIISHLPAAFEDAQVGPIPAADVRPVVLCRDCKYWELSKIDPSFHVCTYVCGATLVRNAVDFCSRGEKREEI